jgi:hypothetical protein
MNSHCGHNANTFITEADGTVIPVKRTLPGCLRIAHNDNTVPVATG